MGPDQIHHGEIENDQAAGLLDALLVALLVSTAKPSVRGTVTVTVPQTFTQSAHFRLAASDLLVQGSETGTQLVL
jgi:hypothetical protein